MIKNLNIKNLAIIDELQINFSKGLNIITGETGSGKSIVINAIDLLLGAKFKKNLIRTGEKFCEIKGEFLNDSTHYFIKRKFFINGKSETSLNNNPISIKKLKNISIDLVDVHGQHQHQKLLNTDYHLEYLDAYIKNYKEIKKLEILVYKIDSLKTELDTLLQKQKDSVEKKDFYKFQLNELDAVNLKDGIDNEIEKEFKKAVNAKEIKMTLENFLYSIEKKEGSLIAQLSNDKKQMDKFINDNDDIQSFIKRIEGISLELKDLCYDVFSYSSTINFNENDVKKISDKFEFIEMIKRKYGGSINAAISYKDNIKSILSDSTKIGNKISLIEHELKNLKKKYISAAKSVSSKRIKKAVELCKKITPILKDVGLKNTRLSFELANDLNRINRNGIDTCEIKISTNLGQELKPLNEIVSGGELSRIMFAIKILLQAEDPVDTIIFDEVDSGISGKIAEKIGALMEDLGGKRQIICITHLSQIACKGNHHISIYKNVDSNKTKVIVEKLSNKKRIIEIASLLSGSSITEDAKNQARQLLLS